MFSSFSSSSPEGLLINLLTLASPIALLFVIIIGLVLLLMAPASFERRLGLWGLFFIFLYWLGTTALEMLQTALMLRSAGLSQMLLLNKWGFVILYLVKVFGIGLLLVALGSSLRAPRTK